MISGRMAAEEKQRVNDALETSEYHRKEWKFAKRPEERHSCFGKYIEERIFPSGESESVKDEYKTYREGVKNSTKEEVTGGNSQTTRQVVPSLDYAQQSQNTGARQIMPSGRGRGTF
jgi:hypothetical protein